MKANHKQTVVKLTASKTSNGPATYDSNLNCSTDPSCPKAG